MATSVDQGNLSASVTGSDALLERTEPLSEAQLLAQATEPAAKADPVPVDAGSGQPIQAAQPAAPAQAIPGEYAADASNVVHLPANISVDNIKVDGKNLILEQADGTEIVVKDAASNVPTFMLGDVELPRVALIAALEAGGVDVAFGADGSISVGPGSANSSGGNFEAPVGGIGDGFDLSALLPPTALQFPQYENRELYPGLRRNRGPAIEIDTGNPGGDADFVQESGLAGIGSNPNAPTEFAGGTFKLSDPDGLSDIQSVTINGKTIAVADLQGSVIDGAHGVLTITNYNPSTGVATYTYELTSPTTDVDGVTETDAFTLTVSDGSDTSSPARIVIEIIDDVPVLVADTDSIAAGSYVAATGNVLSDAAPGDAGDSDNGADTLGADGGQVVGVAQGATGATIEAAATVGVVVNGSYGQLTLNGDGSYSYVRNPGSAGGVSDVFTYTVKDGDGDLVQTTLTIDIGNSTPEIGGLTPQANGGDVSVDEDDLLAARGIGESAGSDPVKESTTQTGDFTITSPDGVKTLVIEGVTVIANGALTATLTVTTGLGNSLTVTGYNPATGVVNYSYTLADNETHPTGLNENSLFENLALTLTDQDDDVATGTLSVNIIDDVPVLVADTDSIAAGSYVAATGNVLSDAAPGDAGDSDNGADTLGADGGQVVGVAQGATGATLEAAATVGVVVNGSHGQLTLNGDGSYSYVRNPGSAGGVSDVFTYTVKDGDGDLVQTTLTIDIGNSTPEIGGLTPQANGGDVSVDEDDLLAARGIGESAGSDPVKESTTQTGDFTITSPDGVKTLVIEGVTVIANGALTATLTVTTGLGNSLTVTGYNPATGVVNYSYTLADNETHPTGLNENSLFENLALTLTDQDDDVATGTLSVNIIDDVPVLVADTDSIAAGSYVAATGNVLSDAAPGDAGDSDNGADTLGADGGQVVGVAQGATGATLEAAATVGVVVNGSHGQLTLNGDGSYSYVRNPGSAGGVSDVFTYTVKDGDGDLVQTTLTIDIGNSTPEIGGLTPQANGGDVSVDEDDLLAARGIGESAGSDPAKESTTQTGDFTITSPDGVKTLVIEGVTVIANGALTATLTVTTGLGNSLTVTGYNPATGVVNYSYTLADNETHPTGLNENSLFENLALTLTDQDDDVATGTLSVNIIDDVPVLVADTDSIAAGSYVAATGNVLSDAAPGDAGDSDNGADTLGADGGQVVGVAQGATGATLEAAATVGVVVNGSHGQLTLNGDGSYSYVRNPGSAGGVSDVFTYTVKDGDGDLVQTTLTIDIGNSTPEIGGLTPQANGGDVSVDEDDLLAARGIGESAGSDPAKESTTQTGDFTITSPDGVKTLVIEGVTVIANGALTATLTVTTGLGNSLTVTGYNPATGVVNYSYTLADNETHPTGLNENSLFENLALTLTDQDDDVATGTLSVNIIDDVPVLVADTDSIAAGSYVAATGNVLSDAAPGDAGDSDNGADTLGADGGQVVGVAQGATGATLEAAATVGVVVNGSHGQLTLNGDGSYSYVRNPGSAGGVSDVFTYTVKDGDGDLVQTTLTIDIGNSTPEIGGLTPQANGGDVSVDEDDLLAARGIGESAGSDPAKESTTQTGDFTITSPDGVKTLVIEGVTVIANGALTATLTVTTGLGNSLTVTGYNPATGVVNYSYTLADNETHPTGLNENSLFENLALTLTDQDDDVATGTLSVNIIDDVPSVDFAGATSVDENAVGTVNGTYLFRPGADGTLTGSITISIGATVIATISAADLANGETVNTPAGQLVLSAPAADGTGSWTFDPSPVSSTTTVNIAVTLTDGDNDVASDTHAIVVNNITGPLVISGAITGTVEEEHGLPGGNEDQTASPDIDADTAGDANATTNIASGSYGALVTGGVDGTLTFAFKTLVGSPAVQTVSNGALTSGGKPVLYAMDGGNLIGYVNSDGGTGSYTAGTDTKVFTITVNPASGAYTFTLNAPVDHPIHTPSTEDNIAINLNGYVTVTDAGGPSPADTAVPLNGSITVIDDTPTASPDTATLDIVVDDLGVGAIVAAWTNVTMTSGSATTFDRDGDGSTDEIRWPDGTGSGYGFIDNPALANTPVTTNETFNLGTFTHFNFPVSGGTLTSTTLSVTFTALINGEQVQVGPILVNFTHDETPNNGTADQNRDIITIATSTTTVTIEGQNYTLDVRGFIDTDGEIVSTVRTYESQQNSYQLAVRFVSSDSTSVTKTGDVISGSDASGADLPLLVAAIAHGATTDSTADGSGNFQVNGDHGTLVINKNGTYTYTLTDDASEIPSGASETFTYTVTDADGDAVSQTLTINLNKVDSGANPLHGDRVLTNISGGSGTDIVISEAALLYNDDAGSTVNGSVSNVTDATSVVNAAGAYTFKDNDSDGGKFTYNGQNGATTDNAIVTVDRSQAGSSTLTGTAFSEILIGSTGNDTISAGDGDDYIVANGGNDTIDGGAGADATLGGAGNDTLTADAADKLIDGGADSDTLNVGANFTSTSDAQIANIENVTLTAAATLNLSNQTEGFTITGSSGADSITAGSGGDTIVGASNDTLLDGGAGTDTLNVAANFTSTSDAQIANIENVTLTAAATLNLANQTEAFTITGSSGNDTITGGSGADSISAGGGTDTIVGAQNDTLLDGGADTDTLQVGANFTSTSDAQIAGIENVTLTAAATLNLANQTEAFTITGSGSDDIITGGSGADSISAGGGTDTIVGAQNDALLDGGSGTDTLQIGANFTSTGNTQIANIENILLTAASTLVLTNQTEGFTITGSAGVDSITGGGGGDIIAAADNDTLIDGGSGTDTLQVGANFTSTGNAQIANIENVTLTAAATLNLANQTEAFTITGSSGNDVITGGSGADSISAGGGTDTIVAAQNDTLIDGGGGTDTLQIGANFTSGNNTQIANIENILLSAAATLNLSNQTEGFIITGSGGDDVITGGSGADSISAGGGTDTIVAAQNDTLIDGGSGADTLQIGANFNSTSDAQIANVENIVLTAAATLNLAIQTEAFTITGSSGDDTITGGAGADSISAGGGTDTIVAAQNDTLIDGGGGTDTLQVGANFTSSGNAQIAGIENIVLTSAVTLDLSNQSEGFTITGSSGDDTIVGGAGNDTITGGDGGDTMTGGLLSADTFVVASGDTTLAVGGAGDAGTLSGFDVIKDFSIVLDKLTLDGTPFAAGNTGAGGTNGTNSALTIGGNQISSHSISNGVITFDDANTFSSALTLTSMAHVAAVVDYLRRNDLGSGDVTVAFTATISGTAHTFIYQQVGNSQSNTNDILVDLEGVTVSNLSTLITAGRIDPIMLDLDNNGYSFSDIGGGIRFDINADGIADQVAWNTSGDGILAYDVNGDGKIDSGAEIFTPDFAGGKFASGAEALASLDSNGDGIVDADDEAFSKLLIWQDANSDGVGEAGELTHLADHGITGLGTSTTASNDVIDGQQVAGEGTVHYADGSSGTYIEVMLDAALGTPEADQPAGETYVIEGLDVADIIPDYDGGKGDQLDLSALLSGLAPDTDLAAQGYVSVVQNGADAEVKVDVDGGGDSFQTVAVLENFTAVNEAVKVLFEDNAGTKHQDNI